MPDARSDPTIGMTFAASRSASATIAPPAPAKPPAPSIFERLRGAIARAGGGAELEALIGGSWLNKIGVADLRGIADALNTRGVRTARGGRWHVSNVKNLIDRALPNALS